MPVLYAKFRTDANHYVYDTSSNQIFNVSPAVWSIIDDYLQQVRQDEQVRALKSVGGSEIDHAIRDIDEAVAAGYFAPYEIRAMRFYKDPEQLRVRVLSRITQLTLEVTQGCNSCCTYCPYSYDTARLAKSQAMEAETAIKAVDLFMEHSRDAPTRAISFWGVNRS